MVLLIKTPLPILVAFAAAAFSRSSWFRQRVLFLVLPAALYFTLASLARFQIGHRHIIPIYPFLVIWAAVALAAMRKRVTRVAVAALGAWLVAGTVAASPWQLSYFNELIGGPANGYKYLTDSSVDWGHGLKALGRYLKQRGVEGIYLCYFGTDDPSYYGIRYVPIGFVDNLSPPFTPDLRRGDPVVFEAGKPILFVVSATNLQGTYYGNNDVFAFLRPFPPATVIAHSLFVYDVTKDPRLKVILREFLRQNDITPPPALGP